MSSEYIPLKVQAEILKRLPLRSILRFRSVSKPWKRLIDSPDFMVSYGVRHPQPHCFILSYEDAHIHNEDRYFDYVDDDHHSYLYGGRVDFIDVPYDDLLLDHDGHPCLVGSSHGLLCFKKIYHEPMFDDRWLTLSLEVVVLWNPSIRKSVRIPLPYMYDFPNKNYDAVNAIGFGVCPVTFDPLILKMKWMDKPGISPWKVRVFTLSTGTWNILSTNLPRESVTLRGSQVLIDRFIFWLAFDMLDPEDGRSQSCFLIMSFDLAAKEFREINLTGCLTNRLCSIRSISKIQESLVLLAYHREFEEDVSVCCLWMMKEQGVNRLFTKLYNINVPHATVDKLLGIRQTGQLRLVTKESHYNGSELELYDPNTHAIVNLGISAFDHTAVCGPCWSGGLLVCTIRAATMDDDGPMSEQNIHPVHLNHGSSLNRHRERNHQRMRSTYGEPHRFGIVVGSLCTYRN